MSNLRLLSVADTAAFRDLRPRQANTIAASTVASSLIVRCWSRWHRADNNTIPLNLPLRWKRNRAPHSPGTCSRRSPANPRSGLFHRMPRRDHADDDQRAGASAKRRPPAPHRRLTVDRCHDRGAVKSQVIHFHVRETISRELTLQLGQPARSLDQRRQAAIDFRPLR